ncbi:3223_t:CDS:2 [Dentiscutata erythropus]|uniref:3223_t:CDS:1 n=1 Tax=Dentiscutata erythropus TaxID=1348616 RepID=A0A9N9NNR9_9GLOM|nr:3223_t:CDS:2 [Dentiscutata erythropus]
MFSKGMNDLGKTTVNQHQIITENTPPIHQKAYHLVLNSTNNTEEPPYEQQLQVHIDLIMNKLQQVQLKAQQNIEIAQQKQKEKT